MLSVLSKRGGMALFVKREGKGGTMEHRYVDQKRSQGKGEKRASKDENVGSSFSLLSLR